MTDLAAEADQLQVKTPHERWIGREERVHPLVWVISLSHQAETGRYTPDVRIDREIRLVKREEHHDPRRLLPHSRGGEEPCHRLVEGKIGEEGEVERSPFSHDPFEDQLNTGRLLSVQPTDLDCFCNLIYRGLSHLIEVSEVCKEGRVGSISVRIIRVLREDCRDKFFERIARGNGDFAVVIMETFCNPSRYLLGVHACEDR